MKSERNILFFLILALFGYNFTPIFAQKSTYSLSGTVKDAATKETIAFATVYLEDLQTGALSDENGNFSLSAIPTGKHLLSVRFLGYATQKETLILKSDTVFHFELKSDNFQLPEVNVMGRTKEKSGSSVIIDKTAMNYIQPSSLKDILQLLPGQLTDDGELVGRSQVTSRQAGSNENTALGMAIISDGDAPLSNNANLQNIANDAQMQSRNTVNKGVDLRMLSTDHIEMVEVVQGIPSAKYGDLSSGMIVTKAKTGKQPVEVRVKANPNGKLFYAGKGVKLPDKWGALHTGIDYTDARPDVRESLTAYKRYSLQLNYTNVLTLAEKPFQFGVKLLHVGTLDATKNDPDLTSRTDTYEANYNRTQLSHNSVWQLSKPWLTSMQYTVSYDFVTDVLKRKLTVSPNGVVPMPIASVEGEAEGIYLPAEYLSEYTMTGKPTTFFSQLSAKSIVQLRETNHVLQWGVQYRNEKNRGVGFSYDLARPPYPTSSTASRPRKFNEIPAMQNLAVFAENKISFQTNNHEGELMAGLRLTTLPGIQRHYTNIHRKWFAEPRLNLWWKFPTFTLWDKDAFFILKAGYGEAIKLPTLDMLNPQPDYHDFISLNYFSQNRENSLLWVTTVMNERINRDLKPNRNRKAEIGAEFMLGKIKIGALVFREISTQGFQNNVIYNIQIFNRYKTDKTFTSKPAITDFEQYKDSLLDAYTIPVNGEKIIKSGWEYSVEIPQIKPIATSIVVNGAYYRTTYDESLPVMNSPSVLLGGKPYKYVGIYAWDRGKVQSRFNTNVWFNTHLPNYRLVFTTKLQALWFTQYQTVPFSGVPLYYFGVGKEITPFLPNDRNDDELRFLVKEFTERFFDPVRTPLQFSIDLKATKEITSNIKMSFYVNRLVFYSPRYYSNLNTPMQIKSTPYFGTEIEIKI